MRCMREYCDVITNSSIVEVWQFIKWVVLSTYGEALSYILVGVLLGGGSEESGEDGVGEQGVAFLLLGELLGIMKDEALHSNILSY